MFIVHTDFRKLWPPVRYFSGWRKHGKPGKLREFEKLSKPRGKLDFLWKKPGKLRENEKDVT